MTFVSIRLGVACATVAAALALAALPRAAHAEATACQVLTTLPVNITTPGRYCLTQDFIQDFGYSSPIRIDANDVVIDCNDHRLRHTVATNSGVGIHAPGERGGIVIRGCVLEGWDTGIFLQASSDPGAKDNRIEDNTVVRSRTTGIYVIGSNNLIQRNRVTGNTGNNGGAAYGIYVYSMEYDGVGNTIRDNLVADFKPTPASGNSSVTGIGVSNLRNTEVTGNVISGLSSTGEYGVIAITGYNANGTTISDNVILTPGEPGTAPWTAGHWYGIYLPGTAEEMASNVCRGNVVGHFNLDIYGCTIAESTGF
jgi:parallel beta-helix repeat protein